VAHHNPPDAELRQLLSTAATIAVVGASSNPERSSHGVMHRLQQLGYRVIPVNPYETEVLGEKAYPTLADVPVPIDIVDVFRRAEHTPSVAEQAARVHAKALWLQQGIWNEDAAAIAKAGGLTVIMDACIGTVHAMLQVPKRSRFPVS
jgi:predicted CoA-binding protein